MSFMLNTLLRAIFAGLKMDFDLFSSKIWEKYEWVRDNVFLGSCIFAAYLDQNRLKFASGSCFP